MAEFTISFHDWWFSEGWIKGFIIGFAKVMKKRLAKMVKEGRIKGDTSVVKEYIEQYAKDYYHELEQDIKCAIQERFQLGREPQKIVGQIMRKYKLPRPVAKYYVDEIYRKNINNTENSNSEVVQG